MMMTLSKQNTARLMVLLTHLLFCLNVAGQPADNTSEAMGFPGAMLRPAGAANLASADLSKRTPWTTYFGSHYQKAPWADSVRDPSGPGRLAGPVSADKLSIIRSYINDKDIILGAGGLGSGRNQDAVSYFLTRMLLDYGEGWKAELKAKAKAIASIPSGTDSVYWQFGNEINSQRFSQTIQAWDEAGGQVQRHGHEDAIIPFYVEYYLAPGVEALWAAAAETNSARFKVVLGSVASFANPRAQKFLNRLLSYRIEGLCAPDLAGKTVANIVDVLALHYIASANTDTWRQALDTVKTDWLDRGQVEAIWSTEELGVRRAKMDAGAVFTIQVAARYLDWWLSNGLSSRQGRAFFWGADVGPEGRTGGDGMRYLLELLDDAQLKRVPQFVDVKGNNIESYSFIVEPQGQILTMIFPRDQKQPARIDELKLRSSRNSAINYRLASRVFSRHKTDVLSQIFKLQGEEWVLKKSLDLKPMSLLVISGQ